MTPLAWGIGAGCVIAALLSVPAADAVRDLAAARGARERVARLAAGPAEVSPIAVEADLIVAGSADRAADALASRLRGQATRSGLLVEEMAGRPAPALARVVLRVSGKEDAVIGFADTLERGRPSVRLSRWTVTARGDGVTLAGEAVAPWR